MDTLLAIAGTALLILLVVNVWLVVRVRRLSKGYARLTMGSQGESLDAVLNEHLDRVIAAVERTEQVDATCKELGRRLEGCVQRVGVIRFDALEDVGGQFSFALALLDHHANGVVISTLHGRQDTRVYVKALREGQSEVTLAAEEVEVLRQVGVEPVAPRLARAARADNGLGS